MPVTYTPTGSPVSRARSSTALAPVLTALTADVRAAATTGLLAPAPTTAVTEQLTKAARQAQASTPDTLRLAVHLVAARAFLREAAAPPALARALSDALALLHQMSAAPPHALPTP